MTQALEHTGISHTPLTFTHTDTHSIVQAINNKYTIVIFCVCVCACVRLCVRACAGGGGARPHNNRDLFLNLCVSAITIHLLKAS